MSSSPDPYWEKVAEKRDVERDDRIKRDVLKSEWLSLTLKKKGKTSEYLPPRRK